MNGFENKKDPLKDESDEEIIFLLHDSSKSFSNYRSAMTTLSDHSHHPLADTDPLISPPSPPPDLLKNPNSSNDLHTDPLTHADLNSNGEEQWHFGNPSFNNDSHSDPLTHADFNSNGEEQWHVGNPNFNNDSHSDPLTHEDLNSNGEDSWPDGNPSKESDSLVLKIKVSNPKKEVESSSSIVPGGNTFVTYLITTKTNIPEFGGPQFTVRRRFKDVVTLSDRLAESYRGFFIPPRPDKSVVESQVMQKQEFVEQRRNALEKYLQRLGAHPVIRQSDELRLFLQVQGKLPLLPTAAVTSRMLDGVTKMSKHLIGGSSGGQIQPQDVVQPAKSRWDFLRIVKEMNQAVSNDWGGSRSSVYEEDTEFLKNKERLLNLEKQLTNSSKQAEIFVKAQQDIAETMGAFGLSFIKLTKFENQHAVVDTQRKRAADMKNLATAAIKSSRYYRELNSRTVKHLDTLHDHMGLLLGVHTAFSDRLSALLTVQTLTSELNSLYSRAEKLETYGNDKPKTLKLGEVKEAIRVTEDAKSCATSEYERIKGNNRTEIERLDRQRKVDLKDMLKGFVLNQVAFSEKIGIEWAKVIEETRGYAC